MKLFSKKKNKKTKSVVRKSHTAINPKREWLIILSVFVCLNIVAVGFHAFLFYQISRGGFFTSPTVSPTTTSSVDRERLEESLDTFSEKERRLLRRVANPESAPSVR